MTNQTASQVHIRAGQGTCFVQPMDTLKNYHSGGRVVANAGNGEVVLEYSEKFGWELTAWELTDSTQVESLYGSYQDCLDAVDSHLACVEEY